MDKDISSALINNIRVLIFKAQENAVRAINKERVILYWNIGKHIVEEEQKGKERAEYGSFLIKTLAQELTKEFGSGFSARQLQNFRQLYNEFPIAHALRAQLSWTQYRLLLRIGDQDKRDFYIEETCKNNWSTRQLERQINSQLYERLLLSNDKEKVLAVAKKENYYNRMEKQKDENRTIEILLCADKNDTMVKFALPEDNKSILASKYQLYLPTEKQMLEQLKSKPLKNTKSR